MYRESKDGVKYTKIKLSQVVTKYKQSNSFLIQFSHILSRVLFFYGLKWRLNMRSTNLIEQIIVQAIYLFNKAPQALVHMVVYKYDL